MNTTLKSTALVLAAAAVGVIAGHAQAQNYPTKPIRIIVPYAPGGLVSIVTMVLSVHPSIPVKSVKEYLALARARPDTLSYGSAGNGSANHLATARFAHMANIKLQHVPYKGGGPAVISIVQGETSTLFATIPSAIEHFRSGRLRPLGVSSSKRNTALPELPTVAEAGLPGYEAIEWQGIMVRAGWHTAARDQPAQSGVC